jgi:signal transduction histidine kinase
MIRDKLRGLQFEIVSSLFLVNLTGIAIVAVVMASLAARTVERAALDELRLTAGHYERLMLVSGMRLSDLAAVTRTAGGGARGAEWSVRDGRGVEVGQASAQDAPGERIAELLALAGTSGEVVERGGMLLGDLVYVRALSGGAQRAYLVGTVPREALLAELRGLGASGGLVLATAAIVFVTFGAYLLRRRIVARVRTLTSATRSVAAGDLEARTDVGGTDELAELAQNFNIMAESLERDRDALVRATDSLARTQRLAAVGQLAAGIAHEVGNPLASILGHAEVALRDPSLGERSRSSAEFIVAEALRVRALVRELLDLARADELRVEVWEPARLLERVRRHMQPQKLLDDIELTQRPAAELPAVETDPRRVEQILVNLIENAAQALSGATGGPAPGEGAAIELVARVGFGQPGRARRERDAAEADHQRDRTPDAVALCVIDNGPGIPAATLPHIFDPFFTTKDPGAGTGLGLWNAHRLAELIGGRLEVESRPGNTCFSLLLPLADGEGRDGAAASTDR